MPRYWYEYVIPLIYANRLRRDALVAMKAMEETSDVLKRMYKRAEQEVIDLMGINDKLVVDINQANKRIKAGAEAARALEDAAMAVVQACNGEVVIIEGDKDDPEPEMHHNDPDLSKIRAAAEACASKATRVASLVLGIIEPSKGA